MSYKKTFLDIFWLIIGAVIMAVALNIFLIPNRIAAGGVSGLGIIFWHLFSFPVGLTILVLNVPLLIVAFKVIGVKIVLSSLLGAIVLSFAVELFSFLPAVTNDLLLAAIYGGIMVGIGVGIVFRSHSTTGGTALAARLINHFYGFTNGQSLLAMDFIVIVLALIFLDSEVAMYALISIFVTGKVSDSVQEGFAFSKAAIIITNKKSKVSSRLIKELDRGVTDLPGRGGYTGENKSVVFCVVNLTEISRLKSIVYDEDPKAFVVVFSVREVLGEGFRPHYR